MERAIVQHGWRKAKAWTVGPSFHYTRPESRRDRQFHQIGAVLEKDDHDAEGILMAWDLLNKMIRDLDIDTTVQLSLEIVTKKGGDNYDLEIDLDIPYKPVCRECIDQRNQGIQELYGADSYVRSHFAIKVGEVVVCEGGVVEPAIDGGERGETGVGFAISMEKLYSALEGELKLEVSEPDVVVIYTEAAWLQMWQIARKLRENNLKVEFLGDTTSTSPTSPKCSVVTNINNKYVLHTSDEGKHQGRNVDAIVKKALTYCG